MIHYRVSYTNPSTHFLHVEMIITDIDEESLQLQLPSWRPGRYEITNYAKNIQKLQAFDEKGKELPFKKITKDLWEIETLGNHKLVIYYNYYAFQLDAGASYLDDKQLYVNPVNCLMYAPKRTSEECLVELKIPEDYKIACALQAVKGNTLAAPDYDTLADSPFIASANMQHSKYSVEDYNFNIWFQGEVKPDWDKIISDFTAFTRTQISLFGKFPAREFHFLVQAPPYTFYHGVEHLTSTVLCIGPGFDLMHERYQDFLGVSSHELFHCWNVKSIRPADMYPYDFTRENYSTLGYVAEGVTTYYGDYMLLRSGVWDFGQYAFNFNTVLNRHFHNYGRFNLSVAMSSLDTWLDGYVKGIPDRKVSIYVKGCLLALMLDIMIRRDTSNEKGLDDVMRGLNESFALQKRGFTEEDLKLLIEEHAGKEYDFFFGKYVHGLEPLEEILQECLGYIGCRYVNSASEVYGEEMFGFKTLEKEGKLVIAQIAPDSPATAAGLSMDDTLLAINGYEVNSANIKSLCRYFRDESIAVNVMRQGQVRKLKFNPNKETYFEKFMLEKLPDATAVQKENFLKWSGHKW